MGTFWGWHALAFCQASVLPWQLEAARNTLAQQLAQKAMEVAEKDAELERLRAQLGKPLEEGQSARVSRHAEVNI